MRMHMHTHVYTYASIYIYVHIRKKHKTSGQWNPEVDGATNYPGDQNSPKALYSMVFGPKSLNI